MKIIKAISEQSRNDYSPKDEPLILHHFNDLEKAFKKCLISFQKGDYQEAVDNIVLVQSAALDIEEILTNKKPKI